MSETTTTTAAAKKSVKGVKAAAPKAAVPVKGAKPTEAKTVETKTPAVKKVPGEITKPDHLRNPQVTILTLLQGRPEGMTKVEIAQELAIQNKNTNLSEMIGSDGGTGNKYTITLTERKMVRHAVQEEGRALVVITKLGEAALKKAQAAAVAAAKE